jgi:Tol biopolymer transport system component
MIKQHQKLFLLFAFLCAYTMGSAQYFGRNKPRYRNFDFKVLSSPNFDVHHYLKDKEVATEFTQWTEQWYDYHSQVLKEKIPFKNPLILYNNHAEFQQTNSIQGDIGVGTGGVTEAFKNRVVMPLTFSNQTTWQVLGHELVHAFQFNSILNGDSTSMQSLGNLPLWIVEGMAEYMSLGRIDPFTSMWMRDAVINDDIPTLMKMDDPKYFAYRYGQAFWSFMTGTYGDGVIKPFFKNTAIFGIEASPQITLNTSLESLSGQWVRAMKNHYGPYLRDKKEKPQGTVLFNAENSGNLNVSPSLSSNGRYIVFLSEKDVFSTDLFLADMRTKKVINKVASLIKDSDLDNLNYLESAGSFSPDGKDFVFVGFKKGRNVLVFKDADNGKTTKTVNIPGVDAFSSPAWSPDKTNIVVTGLVEGRADLFMYNMRTQKVVQLTKDKYSEIMPNFNDDGSKLTFSYDKKSVDKGRKQGAFTYDIAIIDMASKNIEVLDVFHGAENINPSYDHEGNIYFISEHDGFRNMYRYFPANGEVHQMTDLLTGISGISRYSPAIAVSTKRDKVVYTHYNKHTYSIYEATTSQMLNKPVDAKSIDQKAGILPIDLVDKLDIVGNNMRNADNYALTDNLKNEKYKPKFKLDYVGGGGGVGGGMGVGNSSTNNAVGLQGGIDMLFSDMLGNHQIFAQGQLNGEILDLGAQTTYINRSKRLAWGLGLSHIPIRTGYQSLDNLNVDGRNITVAETNLIRVFDKGISAFVHYPFSTTMRLEGGYSGSHRGMRQDIYRDYYEDRGFGYEFLDSDPRENVPLGDTLQFDRYFSLIRGFSSTVNAALVGDNSFFGLTAPLAGHRFRVGVERVFGTDNYTSATVDLRKYFWMKPISVALRTTNYIRFEKAGRVNSIYPYYVGNMGFVRGFGNISSTEDIIALGYNFDQLIGSKIAMGGVEVRLPFTGPRQLSLIPSKFLFTDLGVFFDIGAAFDDFRDFNATFKPAVAKSAGVSLRANLFGYIILEPYYAKQLNDNGKWVFGLNFIPGW